MSIELTDPSTGSTATSTETAAAPVANGEAETKATEQPAGQPNLGAVDMKVWAKTDAENRDLKAKSTELNAKLIDLETKLKATNVDELLQQKLSEELGRPGFAKRMIQAGRTFDDIVAELADIETVDPALDPVIKRLDALEAEKKASESAGELAKKQAAEQNAKEVTEKARGEIAAFAAKGEIVQDEADERNGTARWGIVQDMPEAHEEARAAVAQWLGVNRSADNPATDEEIIQLVSQALDSIEKREREKLTKLLTKVRVNPSGGAKKSGRLITETAELEEYRLSKSTNPSTITSALRGPPPTATKQGRYQGGPRKVTFMP